jgi:hypothetical protein
LPAVAASDRDPTTAMACQAADLYFTLRPDGWLIGVLMG